MKQRTNKKFKSVNEKSWYGLFYGQEPRDKTNIKKVTMIPTNLNQCKICSDGKSVYSNSQFYPGDIIEVCPTKSIDKLSLYTKDMRDIVFEVIPNEKYVIPFGYCQYYDVISKSNPDPNCDYMWDGDNNKIVIRALNRILKNTKLVLNIRK